jgi:alanyl-tRNA synthetase
VPEAVARALEQLSEAGRRVRALQEQSIDGEALHMLAEAGAAGGPCVITRVVDGWDAGLLRLLATRLTEHAGVVALLATRGETVQLVFARSEDLTLDVGALLQDTLRPLGGRGGGRGRVAQGGCPAAAGLEDVLARAAAAARS